MVVGQGDELVQSSSILLPVPLRFVLFTQPRGVARSSWPAPLHAALHGT